MTAKLLASTKCHNGIFGPCLKETNRECCHFRFTRATFTSTSRKVMEHHWPYGIFTARGL